LVKSLSMVQIAHSGSNEEKIGEILQAAQERFGLYGYEKTAMHEIADDLGISKASLYYYYPDKESLFCAVFEKEQHYFIRQLHEIIDKSDNPKELLLDFLGFRMTNFRKLYNLGRLGMEEVKDMKNIMSDLWANFRKMEQEEISRIFKKGMENKLFEIEDAYDTALLYLDAIRGLSILHLKSKDISRLTEEDHNMLDKKLKNFTHIFIQGISNQ
jgi:AcrR family transcriptional regulator